MRFLAFVAGLAVCLPACSTTQSNPEFAANMGEACLTIEGCTVLMRELDAARKECEVGRRPTNCDEREAQYRVVRRQVTLMDAHARAEGEAASQAERQAERDAEAKELESQHASFTAEGQATVDAEAAWARIEPKRCALKGDEDACYALVQFLAVAGDSPHAAEAGAALEAGQRIIEKRSSEAAPGPTEPPKSK